MDIELLNDEAFASLADQVERRLDFDRQQRKSQRVEKEKLELQKELDACDYATQRSRVAFLLNMYPETRDSDMTLTLRYWQVFQSDLYTSGSVSPHLLFKLERLTTIARLRAKIQNDYGLFRGSEEVQRKRRQREETFREDMATDKPTTRMVQVFVDETGKTGDYAIVGSVWFLDPARAAYFQRDVSRLATDSNIKEEFHFAECKKSHLDKYKAFVDLVGNYRALMGFKAIVAKRSGTRRKADDAIKELLRLLLIKGFQEEIETSRLTPPRSLIVTVDQGLGADPIDRENLTLEVSRTLSEKHGDGNQIERISETDSKTSAAIQLADLFSGAINRRLNPVGEQRNHKDDLADYVISSLSPEVEEMGEGDSFSVIRLS